MIVIVGFEENDLAIHRIKIDSRPSYEMRYYSVKIVPFALEFHFASLSPTASNVAGKLCRYL